jgi:hypothetical protein
MEKKGARRENGHMEKKLKQGQGRVNKKMKI